MNPKNTVTAWAWASACGVPFVYNEKRDAFKYRTYTRRAGVVCGPIVRITLPLPKAKKVKR